MHGHDGNGAGGQAAFGIGKVNGAGFGQHIAGHRLAARGGNGLKRRHKGKGRNQNFRLAVYAALGGNAVHSQMQGRRACIYGNNLTGLDAEVAGDFFFKKAHFVAHAEVAVFSNDTANGAGFSFSHNGAGKTHGHKASCCGGITVAAVPLRLAKASGCASFTQNTAGRRALKSPPSARNQ